MGSRHTCEAVLLAAARVLGDEDALARKLEVSTGTLIRWLVGDEPIPLQAFLGAVDVIVVHNRELKAEAERLLQLNRALRARRPKVLKA